MVPELTQGNEKGKVVEGETEVIYVYKKVVSDNSKINPNAPNSDKSNGSGDNSDIKLSSVKTENAPKTGDYSKLPIYVSLAGVAAAILTVMGFKIKKNKR